jgi:hypothetical protein
MLDIPSKLLGLQLKILAVQVRTFPGLHTKSHKLHYHTVCFVENVAFNSKEKV